MFNEKTNQEIFAFLKKQPIGFILPMVEEKFKQEKIKITAIFFNENQISIDFKYEGKNTSHEINKKFVTVFETLLEQSFRNYSFMLKKKFKKRIQPISVFFDDSEILLDFKYEERMISYRINHNLEIEERLNNGSYEQSSHAIAMSHVLLGLYLDHLRSGKWKISL